MKVSDVACGIEVVGVTEGIGHEGEREQCGRPLIVDLVGETQEEQEEEA